MIGLGDLLRSGSASSVPVVRLSRPNRSSMTSLFAHQVTKTTIGDRMVKIIKYYRCFYRDQDPLETLGPIAIEHRR